MKGRGYIYFWRINDSGGRIRACEGAFPGLNVAFNLTDCDAALQQELAQRNIQQTRQCPPPANALLVKFDFSVGDGDVIAINVSRV